MTALVVGKKLTLPVDIFTDTFDLTQGSEFIHISMAGQATDPPIWVACKGPDGLRQGKYISFAELQAALSTLFTAPPGGDSV